MPRKCRLCLEPLGDEQIIYDFHINHAVENRRPDWDACLSDAMFDLDRVRRVHARLAMADPIRARWYDGDR